MIFNKRVLAIIPARSGSKGLKNKNIILIKTTIIMTINQAIKSQTGFMYQQITKNSKKISNFNLEIPF